MHAFRCYIFAARIVCDSGPTCYFQLTCVHSALELSGRCALHLQEAQLSQRGRATQYVIIRKTMSVLEMRGFRPIATTLKYSAELDFIWNNIIFASTNRVTVWSCMYDANNCSKKWNNKTYSFTAATLRNNSLYGVQRKAESSKVKNVPGFEVL